MARSSSGDHTRQNLGSNGEMSRYGNLLTPKWELLVSAPSRFARLIRITIGVQPNSLPRRQVAFFRHSTAAQEYFGASGAIDSGGSRCSEMGASGSPKYST